MGKKEKQVSSMAPVLEYLQKAGMPISDIAKKCGITRLRINQRINLDDCNLSFMEQIADAAGCLQLQVFSGQYLNYLSRRNE